LKGRFQLDTDFLVWALSRSGAERDRLLQLSEADTEICMSAIAWYEFCRGPRSPGQLALAETFLTGSGIVPFSRQMAELAADFFRRLGSPRRRANDISIAATAIVCQAVLLTRNQADFEGLPGLQLG
jgi:predicted nucleic acid-binding protein